MYETTNEQRAERGMLAVDNYRRHIMEYENDVDAQSALADLLTDLMHYAASEGWAWRSAVILAGVNFNEERGE